MGQGRMARVEDAREVGPDDLVPLRRRHLFDAGKLTDAGVVDQEIEATEARDGRLDQLLGGGVITDVGGKRLDAARTVTFDRPLGCGQMPRVAAGDRDVGALGRERARDRQPDTARPASDDRDPIPQCVGHRHYNSPRMLDVAILGAGEIGGSLAYVLARRDLARSVRLIDSKGQVAAGKALDIMQVAPVHRFAARVSGATDITSAGGAHVIVLADRAEGVEWNGEEGLLLLKQLAHTASQRIVVCAGASQRELVERGVRELRYRRSRLFGTAPEALASAVRALVALAANDSARSVSLAVLGTPPQQAVVPWEDVTVGGRPLVNILDEPTRRRLAGRVAPLWPPGPYTLANAAAECIAAISGRSSRALGAFVAPDDSAGIRGRATALPARFGFDGIVGIQPLSLSATAQVALDNAMSL